MLVPPVADPLILILYDVEVEWYVSFTHGRQKARQERASHRRREEVFPTVLGWKSREGKDGLGPAVGSESTFRELESIHQYVHRVQRQRAYRAARSDGTEAEVEARLVTFEGNSHAFLTESYKANVVTHLLDSDITELGEKADVRQATVEGLRPGDALLFHRGSDRDVIRSRADELLAPGVRETSSLWREALLDFTKDRHLTVGELWSRLQDHDCPLQQQTIRTWLDNDNIIAPQAYQRDVNIVAEVTGDRTLKERMSDVLSAIREVRGAHLRASHRLAKQVLQRAADLLKSKGARSHLLAIESDIVVVRVLGIDDDPSPVRMSLANRLLDGDQWHE